jgi:hypothetical protein
MHNSIELLIFFPVVMLCFHLPFGFRRVWLPTASYFFYGYWNLKYLVLIILLDGQIARILFLDVPSHLFLIAILSVGLMECIHLARRYGSITKRLARQPVLLQWSVYHGSVLLILLLGHFEEQQFIYFPALIHFSPYRYALLLE